VSERADPGRAGGRGRPAGLRRSLLKALAGLAVGGWSALAAGSPPPPLRIAAAADLEPLLPPLLAEFERASGIHAEASYASSAAFTAQIENGAPFDLFLSADMGYPARLAREGLGAPGQAVSAYARGTLVLWTRSGSGVTLSGMDSLASPQVHAIAIADPQHAPYGRAAMEALTSLHLLPAVQSRLRTAENIGQAAQFAATGNADVGLLSLTSARRLGTAGRFVPVPQQSYRPILQGALVLKGGSSREGAIRFLEFLRTAAVARQLEEGGLQPIR